VTTSRPRDRAIALAALAAQVTVLYLPDPPPVADSWSFPGLDKAVHVAVFALPTWALWRVWPSPVVPVAMVAQSVASEVVQGRWLSGRGADPLDLLADLAGIGAGLLLARLPLLAWRGNPS